MYRAYFYKLFRSPLFYTAFIATVVLTFYDLFFDAGNGNVYDTIKSLLSISSERKLFIVLSALAFSSNFADEWNSKIVAECVTRKKAGSYAKANVVICFFAAFITIFAGMMVYILIESTQMPLCNPNEVSHPYGELALQGAPFLPPVLVAFTFAISCAAWTISGLMLTAFFPSKYIAICTPLVLSYALGRVSKKLLPDELGLDSMSSSSSDLPPLQAFLLANSVFIFLALVFGIVFIIKVKRRVENELS
ncbi:MAG: hypothetical protein J1F03_06960 [Oscillospiraceae bacterium]|nr:hypothetical protein [Oscillospiraceae bacterium]